MSRLAGDKAETSRIMLGVLDAVEQDRVQSQRRLASELGIALGLTNAYLKRCVKKGLVKVRQAPARRYAYYLTPQGFAEKSRLTVEYLSYSFGFFRQAKTDCSELFNLAKGHGVRSVLLIGQSDLAEIAALCAMEHGVKIVGIVQKGAAKPEFIGLPVFADFEAVMESFDAVLIADLLKPRETCETAVDRFGVERVLVPALLRVRMQQKNGNAR
ncbi:MAG TPA: winged helix-turn-helix transcriptional regulator [Candidatus Acidoferrales bacterium]|nr:winged helix-turn-helix transcriptional regulator [Candidatus Acidoferrales bacterium]